MTPLFILLAATSALPTESAPPPAAKRPAGLALELRPSFAIPVGAVGSRSQPTRVGPGGALEAGARVGITPSLSLGGAMLGSVLGGGEDRSYKWTHVERTVKSVRPSVFVAASSAAPTGLQARLGVGWRWLFLEDSSSTGGQQVTPSSSRTTTVHSGPEAIADLGVRLTFGRLELVPSAEFGVAFLTRRTTYSSNEFDSGTGVFASLGVRASFDVVRR